jgi:hypothetical protein
VLDESRNVVETIGNEDAVLADAFYPLNYGDLQIWKNWLPLRQTDQNTVLQRRGRFLFFVVLTAVAAPFW